MLQSGHGIRKEAAFFLAEAGAKVVVFADTDAQRAKASSEEIRQFSSNKVYGTPALKINFQSDQSVQDMVDFAVEKYGDYAVNAVGVSRH